MRERIKGPIKTTNSNLIQSFLRILHALMQPFYSTDFVDPIKDEVITNLTTWAPNFFWFALI